MNGSKLISAVYPADESNYTKGRAAKITEITVHHMAGINTAAGCGAVFAAKGRNGSSHYGIGKAGEIAQYVSESDTAWANSNWESNCRAVTVEVSNDMKETPWHVSDESYASLVRLVADIAERNGLYPLVPGKNLTWHSMYAATACPGEYILSRMGDIASGANALIMMHRGEGDNAPATWSAESVEWAIANGILKGDENGNLHLRDSITREEAVVMLFRLSNL